MKLIKKILETSLGLLKKGLDLLKGKNLEELAKLVGMVVLGLLALVLTGKSLKALSRAKKAAKSRAVTRGGKVRGGHRTRSGKVKKQSLGKKLLKRAILGK